MQISGVAPMASVVDRLQLALQFASVSLDWVCVACVLARKVYRSLPIFVVYLLFSAITDTILTCFWFEPPGDYQLRVFVVSQTVEYLVEFGVLLEGAATVLRSADPPISLSRMWRATLVLIATIGLLAFSITGVVTYHGIARLLAVFFRSELTVGLSRCALFLILLTVIRQVGIPRGAPIFRATVILGFYFSAASLTQIAHEWQATLRQQYNYYERIECVRTTAWCVAMILISVWVRADAQARPWWFGSASDSGAPIREEQQSAAPHLDSERRAPQ